MSIIIIVSLAICVSGVALMAFEIMREKPIPCKREKHYVSNCCGAPPQMWGDNDSMDFEICPDCKEHCEYIEVE